MRFILATLLCLSPLLCSAESLNLMWDRVTKDISGNPITGVKYKLYRSANGGSFKVVATREGNSYAWYFPILGHYVFRVTAINAQGESIPSNNLKIWIEPIPKLDTVQPVAKNEIGIVIDARANEE